MGKDARDMFLDGNEEIEAAVEKFHADGRKDPLPVLEVIRRRMHADGHFLFPVIRNEKDESQFAFRSISTKDGKYWHAAFTSREEFGKGAPSEIISNFIDAMLKNALETSADGIVINPWGKAFFLSNDLIRKIFDMDGGVEYIVPDERITADLLEDGSFLKRATEICSRNRTQLNMIKLARILRDSWVWIPCNAIVGEEDQKAVEKMIEEAGDDLSSMKGKEFTSQGNIRLVPDILQNGDDFFFPVFTSEEEMGEYGEHFSKVQEHFLRAANLARNNEKPVRGIVINAFTEPFVVPKELFDLIGRMDSSLEGKDPQG